MRHFCWLHDDDCDHGDIFDSSSFSSHHDHRDEFAMLWRQVKGEVLLLLFQVVFQSSWRLLVDTVEMVVSMIDEKLQWLISILIIIQGFDDKMTKVMYFSHVQVASSLSVMQLGAPFLGLPFAKFSKGVLYVFSYTRISSFNDHIFSGTWTVQKLFKSIFDSLDGGALTAYSFGTRLKITVPLHFNTARCSRYKGCLE